MNFRPTLSGRIVAVGLSLALAQTSVAAMLEDGTSGSLPKSGSHSCQLVIATYGTEAATPVVSPGTPATVASPIASPTAVAVASPVASPAASPAASPVASPAASPVASPIASPSVVTETPEAEALDPLTKDLQAATHATLDCMSENDQEMLSKITGGEFRGSWLGFGGSISDEEMALLIPYLPTLPYALMDISDATISGKTATATVTYLGGRQVHTGIWTFSLAKLSGKSFWRVDRMQELPVQSLAGAHETSLTITDGSFTLEESSLPAGNITVQITNTGKQPHEALIVRTPGVVTAGDFAAAPNGLPKGSTFVGQITVPAGSTETMVISDLRAGNYTIVDMLPDEQGLPNISSGMITTFKVTD